MGLKMITGADYAKCIAIACFIEKSLPCCKTSYLIIYIISYYIIYYVIYIYYITLHYITLYHIILYYIILYHTISYYIILYYIILYCIIPLNNHNYENLPIAGSHRLTSWNPPLPKGIDLILTDTVECAPRVENAPMTHWSLWWYTVYIYIYTYMNIFVRY